DLGGSDTEQRFELAQLERRGKREGMNGQDGHGYWGARGTMSCKRPIGSQSVPTGSSGCHAARPHQRPPSSRRSPSSLVFLWRTTNTSPAAGVGPATKNRSAPLGQG